MLSIYKNVTESLKLISINEITSKAFEEFNHASGTLTSSTIPSSFSSLFRFDIERTEIDRRLFNLELKTLGAPIVKPRL